MRIWDFSWRDLSWKHRFWGVMQTLGSAGFQRHEDHWWLGYIGPVLVGDRGNAHFARIELAGAQDEVSFYAGIGSRELEVAQRRREWREAFPCRRWRAAVGRRNWHADIY